MHIHRATYSNRVVLPRRRASVCTPRAALDPDNANILVCGGGGVALQVTRKLKDMGSWVWAMQRSDARRCELRCLLACRVAPQTRGG